MVKELSSAYFICRSLPSRCRNKDGGGDGHPWLSSGQESACGCRGHAFRPWSSKIPPVSQQLSPGAKTTTFWDGNIDVILQAYSFTRPQSTRRDTLTSPLQRRPHQLQAEETLHSNEDPSQPKLKKKKKMVRRPQTQFVDNFKIEQNVSEIKLSNNY